MPKWSCYWHREFISSLGYLLALACFCSIYASFCLAFPEVNGGLPNFDLMSFLGAGTVAQTQIVMASTEVDRPKAMGIVQIGSFVGLILAPSKC